MPDPLNITLYQGSAAGTGTAINVGNFVHKSAVVVFDGSGQLKLEYSNDGSNFTTAVDADGNDADYTADGNYRSEDSFKWIRANHVSGTDQITVYLHCK